MSGVGESTLLAVYNMPINAMGYLPQFVKAITGYKKN
jgi:hypothetical protein